MRYAHHLGLSGLAVACCFVSTVAVAQPSTGEAPTRPGQHRVSGEFDFYHSGVYSSAFLGPAVYARFRLYDARAGLAVLSGEGGFVVDLDAAWRGVGLVGDVSEFRMGNPFVGLRIGTDGEAFTARGGLGVTLPLTNAYDDTGFDVLALYLVGIGTHGVWDLELVTPQTVALMLTGDAQLRSSMFMAGGDAGFTTLFSVPRDGPAGDPDLVLKLGVYGAVTPIPQLAVGLRFQMVTLINTGGAGARSGEEGYLALAPFVRVLLGPAFAELRLWMNLDDPYGFAFDDGKVWSLAFSGGINF